jgi:hypothetical protein
MTQTSKKYSPDPLSAKPTSVASNGIEVKNAKRKVSTIGQENTEQFAESADMVSNMLNDTIEMSRATLETCMECGNRTAALVQDVKSEVSDYANKTFSDAMATSKDFLACRTLNDMFELQGRIITYAVDSCFNQSSKLSGMMFEYASEILKPSMTRSARIS